MSWRDSVARILRDLRREETRLAAELACVRGKFAGLGNAATPEQIARGEWRIAPLELPFGRGVKLELPCEGVAATAKRLAAADWAVLVALHEKSYRVGDASVSQRLSELERPH